jgi:dihydrodipicolinate synthase/N-acetylneuraminate lyase
MTPFPPIQRPCPYLDRLDTVIDVGFCRMCRRDVHDLTAMEGPERAAFLASCGGDACVSYTMNVKPALAAALIAASAAVLAAPDPALAASHQAGRNHHGQSPVDVPTVMVRTAGIPAMPVVEPARDPIPPPPPAETRKPPQKPD